MDRRHFLNNASAIFLAGSTTLAWADEKKSRDKKSSDSTVKPVTTTVPTSTAVKSRVIVIGGGMAGATVAKYLRLWGDGIAVTLIEREASYTSNIMSSMVLTGQRTLASLSYRYDNLLSAYGVQVIRDDVVEIDTVGVKVKLASGTQLSADRIVLAPGIDFDTVEGLGTSNRMPHAWKAGPQTALLAQQLAAMPDGGRVVLTIPKTPYRCPPGPYERACLLADWLKARKPRSKLIVLDANADFVTEKDNFSQAFLGLHGSMIEYHTNAEVTQVDPVSMSLTTTAGTFNNASVVNLIPRQRAGSLVAKAGLANATEGRFAAVDVLTYASTLAPRIHIIGDASATTQPKAGHIANQEAKTCADAIVRGLAGFSPDPAPVTNSACYSTITMSQASWLTAVFQYDRSSASMKAVAASSAASIGWNKDNFEEMNIWFKALMADSFT
jgi:NADPH-dependent 2,4-dienoyl-CoA reductase/sulfur reductase-like enzyme